MSRCGSSRAGPAVRAPAIRWQRDRMLRALTRHAEGSRRRVAVRAGAAWSGRLWLWQSMRQRDRRQQPDDGHGKLTSLTGVLGMIMSAFVLVQR